MRNKNVQGALSAGSGYYPAPKEEKPVFVWRPWKPPQDYLDALTRANTIQKPMGRM